MVDEFYYRKIKTNPFTLHLSPVRNEVKTTIINLIVNTSLLYKFMDINDDGFSKIISQL
jgi:hypothetical protein